MVSDDTADQPTDRDDDWEPDRPTRVDDETVVVPMRMYKGITVFSTLLAVVLVVGAFFMFDAATQSGNPIRQALAFLLSPTGVGASSGLYTVGFGLLGVLMLLVGAGSYILGTRFKTAGMLGGDDEDGDAESDDEETDSEDRSDGPVATGEGDVTTDDDDAVAGDEKA